MFNSSITSFTLGNFFIKNLLKINSNEFNFTKSNYINAQVELINSKYEQLFNTGLLNFYLGEDFSM